MTEKNDKNHEDSTVDLILVRRIMVDLESPLQRHWFNEDAFQTAFFSGLSQGFPPGEQLFIDSVRDAAKRLPEETQIKYKDDVKGFIGQEATHRRIHGLFNAQLAKLGLVNAWEPRAQRRIKMMDEWHPMHKLALTAAYEHFTNLLAIWMFNHQEIFDQMEPRLTQLWLWHASEEAEHASVAFNIYKESGGKYWMRVFWFLIATIIFTSDALHQTYLNLRSDKTLWKWSSWASGLSFLLGKKGLLRNAFSPWCSYLKINFHPTEHRTDLGAVWLNENRNIYSLVTPKHE